MPSYVFDSTLFKPGSSASVQAVVGGEAIAVGDAVYRDTTDNQWFKCDADNATAGGTITPRNTAVEGLAASACAGAGCQFVVCTGDSALVTGATTTQIMAAGDVLVVSGTAGKLQPAPADSGDKLMIAGVANSATEITLKFVTGGTTP